MLTDFVFEDSGISVKIRKVSPMLAADVSAAMPEPLPPEQWVDYGEPKGKVLERNYSDGQYLADVKAHQTKLFVALQRIWILRSVIIEGDAWRDEVKEYREFMLRYTGVPIDEPEDLVVYVLRICVSSEEDLVDLLGAITKRAQPTTEVIEAAKSSFRG